MLDGPPKLGQPHSTMRLIWRVRGFIDITYLTKDMVRQDSLGMENYILCLVSVGIWCEVSYWPREKAMWGGISDT